MKLPLRIAILECDDPLPGTTKKYGGYGGVFEALLTSGASLLSHPGLTPTSGLEITKYNVEHEELYPDLSSIDAILLTGSKSNAFDNLPWILRLVDFVDEVLKQGRVRVIGVCFGHQIVGRAMGAPVGRSTLDWEVSVTPVELVGKGKELFGKETLNIFQMHRDIVYEVPKGAEQLGRTGKCEVQGFYIKNKVITVQGHPEFNEEIVREIIDNRYQRGIFTQEEHDEYMSRVANQQDGVLVGAAFLKFLLDD